MLAWLYSRLIDPLLRETRSMIPGFAGMTSGDRVLDVCCGTGAQVNHYAGIGLNAVGIDINTGMIYRAVDHSKDDPHNGSFLAADSTCLPFPSGSFDFVSISFGLHDKPEPARSRTVDEMKRVVKPGGTLVFVDFHVPLPGNTWGILARIVEFLAGGSHYRGFRQFVRSGGLPYLLAGSGVIVTGRVFQAGGLMEMVKGANESFSAPSQPSSREAN